METIAAIAATDYVASRCAENMLNETWEVSSVEAFDHIIIGGGVLGLSIAYHLARNGGETVLVLERNELASAASSKAAGLILQSSGKPFQTPMVKITRDTFSLLEEDLGEPIGFHEVGSLRIAASAERAAELENIELDATNHGIPFQNLSADEAQEKAPWLNPSTARRISFFPTDGYVDPYVLSTSYGRAAQKFGALIRPRTAVTDLIINAGHITGVKTRSGDIFSGSIIDAAGAWASLLATRAGYPLPMTPTRSHYWIAAPDAGYRADFPVTLLPDPRAYARPEVGGMVLGVQEMESATFDARELPYDINSFSPTQGEEHWDILIEAMEAISMFFPKLPDAQFTSYVSGLSTYTPDGNIILGAVPGCTGLLAATGCCGNGISLSAGVGAAIAALARNEEPRFDLTPFAVDRFGPVDPFSPAFRDRCAAARAAKSRNPNGARPPGISAS